MAWQSLTMLQILNMLWNEGIEVSHKAKHSHELLVREACMSGTTVLEALNCVAAGMRNSMEYLSIAMESE